MRRPEFWRADGPAARALAPASWLYGGAAAARRALARPAAPPVPVLCVGNLTAGGAGKTPTALALGGLLRDRRRGVHFLTRGYGGRARGPLRVDPSRHDAAEVGDEPLLLAGAAPCWVARDRRAGVAAAARSGAELVVMDDGFQNPTLAKTRTVVVVDGVYGFGNRRLLPAGPLRETVRRGLARADRVVLVEPDEAGVAAELGPSAVRARLAPAPGSEALAGRAVVAFAGVAAPEKPFRTLAELGCRIVAAHRFGDHHRYTEAETMAILEEAARVGAAPVTTAKDWVRLPPTLRGAVEVLDVVLEWEEEAAGAELVAGL